MVFDSFEWHKVRIKQIPALSMSSVENNKNIWRASMTYTPPHYLESRSDLILEVIQKYGFATVITSSSSGPFISHIPLVLENKQTLLGHCARANPHWRHFAEGQIVTTIFNGPHAYISPAWYEPQVDNVPTWNYVAVHVRAKATIIEDQAEIYRAMVKLVNYFETKYKTNWSLPLAEDKELESLYKAIVVFRLDIQDIQAKFKLSQKQPSRDRENVITQLPSSQGSEGASLAEYMSRVMSST